MKFHGYGYVYGFFLFLASYNFGPPHNPHREENFAERPMPQEETFGPKGAYGS